MTRFAVVAPQLAAKAPRTLWQIVLIILHPSARAAVAGFMLIMADWLSADAYGTFLAIMGGALLASVPWRLHWWGRVLAALGAILLAGMAFDVGALGNTALVEGWFALLLFREVFTNHEC